MANDAHGYFSMMMVKPHATSAAEAALKECGADDRSLAVTAKHVLDDLCETNEAIIALPLPREMRLRIAWTAAFWSRIRELIR